MSTNFDALDALYPLPAEELFRQWVLTQDPQAIPGGWEQWFRDGWHLGAHPDARVCELRAQDGASMGWAIEPHVYLGADGGVVPRRCLTLPVDSGAPPAEVEEALYGRNEHGWSDGNGLIGPWVAITFGGPEEARFSRVYLGATCSVVYSARHRTVATSHNLIRGLRRDETLSRAFDPLATGSYYTFGLTAFRDLRRLLPNHYLDLDTFRPTRHWPVESLPSFEKGEEGAATIVEYSRQFLALLASAYRSFLVFLSAGRDSRAVLALLRPLVKADTEVVLSTTVGWDFESRTDLQAARRLARIAGLPHGVSQQQRQDTNASDVRRGFVRIGEARAGSFLAAPSSARRDADTLYFKVGGMAGETGRAFFWQDKFCRDAVLLPEDLARRTGSPLIDPVVEAAEAWLEGLPDPIRRCAPDALDLAYVEHRLGGWQAPSTYLFPGQRWVINPMAEAFNIEAMLRLPSSYRATGTLQRDIVKYGWPELLDVPFNQPTGWLRLLRTMVYYANRARFYLSR